MFDDTAPTPVVTFDAEDGHQPSTGGTVDPGATTGLTGRPPVPVDHATGRPAVPVDDVTGQPAVPGDDAADLGTLGDDVTAVLRAAHVAARELRARAEAEAISAAVRLRRKAEAEAEAINVEADRVLRAAEQEAAVIRAQAEESRREAEAQAAELRAELDRMRRAMEAEAAARKASVREEEQQRQQLIRELEDLRTQRNEALDSYVVLRRTLRAVDVAIEKWHKDEPASNWRHNRR